MRLPVQKHAWVAAGLIAALTSACDPKTPRTEFDAAIPAAINAAAAAAAAPALPDFSALVDQVGPAVVNISTVRRVNTGGRPGAQPTTPEEEQLHEFLRRFGMPFEGEPAPARGLGSGLIVTADGRILTNAHLVAEAAEVTVKLNDNREFKAKVIGADRRTDIAVLKIDATNLPIVKIGDPAKTKVGEWVAAIGSPFGLENSVTSGIVSAKSRSLPDESYVPFIQTDVAVNPGSSGGPLLNLRGEVIGINSQIYSRTGGYMGLSFAIPINVAMKVQGDLVQHGKVSRGQLGVAIQEVDQALARSFKLPKPGGALVNSVEKGTSAEKAGLVPGDIILKFDGNEIDRINELPNLVADIKPGTRVKVEIWRRGARKVLYVTVEELPDEGVASAKPEPSREGDRTGLVVRPLTPEEREAAKIADGLMVENADGAAARAGIQPGDVILGVNAEPAKSPEQLREAISRSGDVIALLVQRDTTRVYVAVKPG